MKFFALLMVFYISPVIYSQQAASSSSSTRWQYVVLNDKSGRTLWPGGIKQQANVAAQFLKEVVQPGSDVGSLANFDEEYSFDVKKSTNPEELALKLAREGRHGTSVYDAILWAAEWLSKQESSQGRKIVFVFSDGDDDASQESLRSTSSALRKLQIPIVILAPSIVEHDKDGDHVRQLATSSGGRAYFVPNVEKYDFTPLKLALGR